MRRLALSALAALVLVLTLSGCEYLEGEPEPTIDPADPSAPQIGGVITAAIDGYNTYGPTAMFPFMALEVTQVCTEEQFVADMADAADLTTLRMMKSIEHTEEGGALVTLDVITADGDMEQVWTMTVARNNVWKILDVPGMSDCKVA